MFRFGNYFLIICALSFIQYGCGEVRVDVSQGLEFSKDLRFEGVTVDAFLDSISGEVKGYRVRGTEVCSEPYVMFNLYNVGVYVLSLDMSDFMFDGERCVKNAYEWKDWFDKNLKDAIIIEATKIEGRIYRNGQSSAFYCTIDEDGNKICKENKVVKGRIDRLYKDINPEDYLFDELLIVD